jgi:hypothetical protein
MPSPVRGGNTEQRAVHTRPACVCYSVSFACMLRLLCPFCCCYTFVLMMVSRSCAFWQHRCSQ